MAGTRKGATGVRRLLLATRYSFDGFNAALGESAFRQELALAAVLLPLGIYLGKTGTYYFLFNKAENAATVVSVGEVKSATIKKGN